MLLFPFACPFPSLPPSLSLLPRSFIGPGGSAASRLGPRRRAIRREDRIEDVLDPPVEDDHRQTAVQPLPVASNVGSRAAARAQIRVGEDCERKGHPLGKLALIGGVLRGRPYTRRGAGGQLAEVVAKSAGLGRAPRAPGMASQPSADRCRACRSADRDRARPVPGLVGRERRPATVGVSVRHRQCRADAPRRRRPGIGEIGRQALKRRHRRFLRDWGRGWEKRVRRLTIRLSLSASCAALR